MAAGLPERIDPLSWAESGHRLQGRLSVSDMPRLQESLYSTESKGSIHIDLEGGIDDNGTRYLRGRIEAKLEVPCQRCLRAMQLALGVDVALGLVSSPAKADYLAEPYEALMVEGRSMALAGIVEDELLLAIPIVAMHADAECLPAGTLEADAVDVPERRENPFAVLARLKKQS